MIVGADHRVRNAFRATLIDEPSSPSIALATQEVDAADVLEVADLAHAIARAEEVIRATRSSHALLAGPESSGERDIFDHLTDDCSGPAVHAPWRPTPVPIPPPPRAIAAPPPLAPAACTAPILIFDEDAFYHPAGRIRGFAEVTLDGYRPEPTLLVRLRGRRNTLVRIVVVGVLAPLVLLALFVVSIEIGRARASRSMASLGPSATTPAVATAQRIAPSTPAVSTVVAPTLPAVPVFDVNSLKSAPPVKPRQ